MNVNFVIVTIHFVVRESKLAEVRDLRSQVTTRQTELMEFILLLKARKRELKKNLGVQRERMQLCFSEIRSFLDFYEK